MSYVVIATEPFIISIELRQQQLFAKRSHMLHHFLSQTSNASLQLEYLLHLKH